MAQEQISNVLARRYASPEMREIWSEKGRVMLERGFWIAVMKAQRDLGLAVPEEAIASCQEVMERVDLDSIRAREAVTLHDVKARIEEFCALAGHQHIHKGMTSRDLTENVEQLQILRSLRLARAKTVATLLRLARRARQYRDLVLTGRTHNVPAQVTTLGKRFAMFGQELLEGLRGLDHLCRAYPVRGLKGAVGTRLDQLTLLGGDGEKAAKLDALVVQHLGFERTLDNVGQVYPRGLDFEVVGRLYQVSAGASSFAKTIRLMAGQDLAGEGFLPGQVGSSAMPHKMNSRSCERINGFHIVLNGYLTMTAALAGDQWNEGDVSCSVVRRVALPDAFFAFDGLMETFLTVLDRMEIHASVIREENTKWLPFLATTTILMEAVKAGAGRETAHEAIKEHAVAAARALHGNGLPAKPLAERLASDPRIGLGRGKIDALLASAELFTGSAGGQVDLFAEQVEEWGRRVPEAAGIEPGAIL